MCLSPNQQETMRLNLRYTKLLVQIDHTHGHAINVKYMSIKAITARESRDGSTK